MDEDNEQIESSIVGKFFLGMYFCGELRPYFWHNETVVRVHRDAPEIWDISLEEDEDNISFSLN